MNVEKIILITDGERNIDYAAILSFYEIAKQKTFIENKSFYNMAIIDIISSLKEKEELLKIRKYLPSIPVLILTDFTRTPNQLLNFTAGFGPTRILRWRNSYPELILDYTQNLLNPEFPTQKSDIAIILPVYNEESRFSDVYSFFLELRKLLEKGFINGGVYFVNDGSSDKTQDLIDQVVKEDESNSLYIRRLPLLQSRDLGKNTRKAGTYIDGIKNINADILIFADADGSFSIDDIAKMVNIIRDGYFEFIAGTKDMTAEHRPLIRRMMSFAKRLLTKRLLPKGIYDSQTGLKAMNSVVAHTLIDYMHEDIGLASDLEMLYLSKIFNFRVLQLPVFCDDKDGSHVDIIKDSIMFLKAIFRIPARNRKIRKIYG